MGWVFVFRACVSGMLLLVSLLSLCGPVRAQSLYTAKALDDQALERYRAGNFRQARDLAEQALALREKILGNDHPGRSFRCGEGRRCCRGFQPSCEGKRIAIG